MTYPKMGLNITVTIQRREYQPDDSIGGAKHKFSPVMTGIPARITTSKIPYTLRAQGIDVRDTYDCLVVSPDYRSIDVRYDDIVIPESGQYQDDQFRVKAIQDTSLDDNPNDYRGFHKLLQLERRTPSAGEMM